MRVTATAEETELEGENDSGHPIPIDSLIVTCERCGHTVEVYGTSSRSARRGAAMLREECPYGESNFYVLPGEN